MIVSLDHYYIITFQWCYESFSYIIIYERALDLEVKSRVVNPYILCVLIQSYRDLEHRNSVVLSQEALEHMVGGVNCMWKIQIISGK